MFQSDAAPLDVAKGSETSKQSLAQGSFFLRICGMPQNSNCRDAALLLSVRREWPREDAGQGGQHEAAAVHAGMVGRMGQKVNHVTRGS
jgi:hypothetical protein